MDVLPPRISRSAGGGGTSRHVLSSARYADRDRPQPLPHPAGTPELRLDRPDDAAALVDDVDGTPAYIVAEIDHGRHAIPGTGAGAGAASW